jgi:hypothetical protein
MSEAPFDRAFADVEARIARVEAWPDDARKAEARELASALLEVHRQGIARLLRALGPSVDAVVGDPGLASLLVLHGLHPHELGVRARAAVARLQGAFPDLELERFEAGNVVVRVGARGGAATAPEVVRQALLEAVPDAVSIEVRPVESGLIRLGRRGASP